MSTAPHLISVALIQSLVASASAGPLFSWDALPVAPFHPVPLGVHDVDGDGNSDLVILGDLGTAQTLFSDATGRLSPGPVSELPVHYNFDPADSALLGDFNNDGLVDVISSTSSGLEFAFSVGQASGRFLPSTVTQVPGLKLHEGDFDGDGNLDVFASDTLKVSFGDGTGAFSPVDVAAMITMPSDDDDSHVEAADFDGDGRTEIAVLDTNAGLLTVYRDQAGGDLAPAWVRPVSVSSFRVGDVDGDGTAEILVADGAACRIDIFSSNGDGLLAGHRFIEPASCDGLTSAFTGRRSVVADMDADGIPDIMWGRTAIFLDQVGNIDDVQAEFIPFDNSWSRRSILFDQNHDHLPDFLALTAYGWDYVFSSAHRGTLYTVLSEGPRRPLRPDVTNTDTFGDGELLAVDLNGDSIIDLVSAGAATTFIGDGRGGYAASQVLDTGNEAAWGTAAGDFDQDGDPDLLIGSFWGLYYAENQGGVFAQPVNAPGGPRVFAVRAVDFDQDSMLDAVTGDLWNGIQFLRGHGDGTFTVAASWDVPHPYDFEVLDLNADGYQDVVSVGEVMSGLHVTLGGPDLSHQPTVTYTTHGATVTLVVEDLNGDGHPDVAVPLTSRDRLAVFIGDGSGGFGPATLYPAALNSNDIEAGDVDLDGVVDLVTSNQGHQLFALHRGIGDGSFADPEFFATGVGPVGHIVLVDSDTDGDLDVVQHSWDLNVGINRLIDLTCPADFTGDAQLNFFDVAAFISAFNAQQPAADFQPDGLFNFFDVDAYLDAYNAGCP